MRHNVIIVGTGPAGVGLAAAFRDFNIPGVRVIDRHGVGASFDRWPSEMRLITPSFNTTPFGILDLNAVALNTSVANYLGTEHPTGPEYARYLRAVLKACDVEALAPWEVKTVTPKAGGGFLLEGPHGRMECEFLVWAAGEFQFPRLNPFPGAEFCLHNATLASYASLPRVPRVVIGAFESGVDAAVHLARRGVEVTLLCADSDLALSDQDPSQSLSPFTRERLNKVLRTRRNLRIRYESRVTEIRWKANRYQIDTGPSGVVETGHPPILATGFHAGTGPVRDFFDYREDGEIFLSEDDESTRVPGLFLSGPLVRHEHHIFCYIYKFRQRFAVIAETIADRLGLSVSDELLEHYERNQMRLVDLSCCGQQCAC